MGKIDVCSISSMDPSVWYPSSNFWLLSVWVKTSLNCADVGRFKIELWLNGTFPWGLILSFLIFLETSASSPASDRVFFGTFGTAPISSLNWMSVLVPYEFRHLHVASLGSELCLLTSRSTVPVVQQIWESRFSVSSNTNAFTKWHRGWVAWLGSKTENFCNVHKMFKSMRLAVPALGEVYTQSNVTWYIGFSNFEPASRIQSKLLYEQGMWPCCGNFNSTGNGCC